MKINRLIAIALIAISTNSFAHQLQVNVSLSPAGNFEAKNLKLKGEIKFEKDTYTADNLWVKVEDFTTGIDLRDEHFKKHFNPSKNPKLTLSKVVAKDEKGTGILNVNGVDQKIEFTYKIENKKTIIAKFTTSNALFKLPEAKYMGIGVNDDVEIIATLDL
jgi:hypothetical protein